MRKSSFCVSACVTMIAIVALACMPGCRDRASRISVTTYRQVDRPQQFYQDFEEGSFRCSAGGQYEILLTSSEPISSLGRQVLQQSLHVQVFWRPQPGKTFAESSQINAQVQYRLQLARSATKQVSQQTPEKLIRYEGSGFVSFSLDRKGEVMRGVIERALLEPCPSPDTEGLGRLILKGKFTARQDPERIALFKITRARNRD